MPAGEEEVRSLTILTVAFPFARLGPSAAGGAEQVAGALDAALAARGWQSIVVAHSGSQVAGRLAAVPTPKGPISDPVRNEVQRQVQAAISRVLANCSVDLIHLHGFDFHRYDLPRNLPILATLHLPASWYPDFIWNMPENYTFQCVSRTQLEACPRHIKHRLVLIENGVNIPNSYSGHKGKFALMRSRICPEKNLHVGLQAAQLANTPVLLAGDIFPYAEHLHYFETMIRPLLGRGRARWLRAVGGEQKNTLLSRAKCLLLPTLAPETSSLVAMEAAAAGTPVCAFPSGEIANIVEEGRTGFLVHSAEEMARAISKVREINSEQCRAVAASRFPLSRMNEKYLCLYRSMIAAKQNCRAFCESFHCA